VQVINSKVVLLINMRRCFMFQIKVHVLKTLFLRIRITFFTSEGLHEISGFFFTRVPEILTRRLLMSYIYIYIYIWSAYS